MTNKKSPYGRLLVELIKKSNMSQSDFYQKVGIKKPYFYDIISGKCNPPPPDLQIKIINTLNITYSEKEELLDCASILRNEIPSYILTYLLNNEDEYKYLRTKIKKIKGDLQ